MAAAAIHRRRNARKPAIERGRMGENVGMKYTSEQAARLAAAFKVRHSAYECRAGRQSAPTALRATRDASAETQVPGVSATQSAPPGGSCRAATEGACGAHKLSPFRRFAATFLGEGDSVVHVLQLSARKSNTWARSTEDASSAARDRRSQLSRSTVATAAHGSIRRRRYASAIQM